MLTPHYKEQGDTGKRKEEKSMAEMEELTRLTGSLAWSGGRVMGEEMKVSNRQ